jgi:hypothetical protein
MSKINLLLVPLGIVLLLCFSVPFLAADKNKRHHHHHNRGAHLSVVIDCKHPTIRNSDDAPGWVLVQYAEELGLNIEVKNSQPVKDKPNLLQVEIVIPIDVKLSDCVSVLEKIEFVIGSKVLPKGGNDE